MKTNYPILLVHGFILKDFLIFNAFGKIPKILSSSGFCVYTSTNDGVGTIETNARQLKKQIEEILKKEKSEKINIIAHSKGGLDCEYMIKNLNMESKVASLTTICTPHKGSRIATSILKFPKWLLIITSKIIDFIYKISGDKKPNVLRAAKELRSNNNYAEDSNNISNKVYFQSYSTVLEKGKDDLLMAVPFVLSKKHDTDESDGLVSKDSAKFGNYKGDCINGSISHTEIVDLMTTKKEKEKVYNFYKKICHELALKDF